MYSISTEKKFAVMPGLVEGNSIRSRSGDTRHIERNRQITSGISKNCYSPV